MPGKQNETKGEHYQNTRTLNVKRKTGPWFPGKKFRNILKNGKIFKST
jgi:hypothetical protein